MSERTHKKSNWLSTTPQQDSALKLRRFTTKDDKDEEIQQSPDINPSKFSLPTNSPFPDSNIQRQEIEGEIEEGEETPGAQLKSDKTTSEEPEEEIQTKSEEPNQEIDEVVQTKLTVGQPGDKYEQEADTVAAKVVEQINSPQTNQPVQGKVEPVVKPTVMRQGGADGEAVNQDVEQNIQQARGSGQGLAENVRQPMEQAFGADFSSVKVHTNGQADVLNRSLNSRAFATGQDIFFKQGEYQPGSKQGQELLAHELTHVVQQGGTGEIQTSSFVQKETKSIIQKQEYQRYEEQKTKNRGVLNSFDVDEVMWNGFYKEWLSWLQDADNVENEARNIVKLIPENQGYSLTQVSKDIVKAQFSSSFALERAIRLREEKAHPEKLKSAVFHAEQLYYDLIEIVKEVRARNEKYQFLLKAKVFEFLSEFGRTQIAEAKALRIELKNLNSQIKKLQKRITSLPKELKESFMQLGVGVAMGIALTGVSISSAPLAIAIAAASTGISMKLDRLWGATSEHGANQDYKNSDLNALTEGVAGVTENLTEGKSKLALGAKALGKVSTLVGIYFNSKEVKESIQNYKKRKALLNQLSKLEKRYQKAEKRYNNLAPILQNYDLAIKIVNGFSQEARNARKQFNETAQ